ncbi:MAG: selenide, water dikinase SelD [Planctomycetes bacterium]|nr:selenide, water dikinase SelD [Planctomycetota bacterium]
MNDSLPKHDIVLLGAGHTHAHIIRMWRMQPIPQTRLTCISDHTVATYSGMMAGTLAGNYQPSDMEIDLVRLCASCGVRFIHGKVTGLDVEGRRLRLENRPEVTYDLLSVGIGSQPTLPTGNEAGLSIKPMQTFLPRLRKTINKILAQYAGEALQIAIVGGGASGVEIAFCLQQFIKHHYGDTTASKITLVDAGQQILGGMSPRTQKLANRELQRRGIQLRMNSRIVKINGERELVFEEGARWEPDLIIWATSAKPPALLGALGLPLDERGFLLTRNTLQSSGEECIFAVGDTSTVEGERYAKAGVYAVRQGPVLWENLRRKLEGQPLQAWQPQSQFLALINTGDERAILDYRGLSFHARWCWRLKNRIDTKFMAMYQSYDPPEMMHATAETSADAELAKQCGGCGSKASARVLQKSLPALQQSKYDHVLMGLDPPDDIALLAQRPGLSTAVSIDFFSAFVDDPFLLGRIAALNALSDLHAKGATPSAALSVAILPHGSDEQQARLLNDLLAGAVREFSPHNVPIVGGHSIMGPKLTFGFTILGDADAESVMRKSALSLGDCLVLTKPLGTGVLLAAHMQAACRTEWWTTLVESMLVSNQHAATVASEIGVNSATDVTGFGLAAHLLEMLKSSGFSAEISLGSLPLLPGAAELLENGFESTLAPSNRDSCCDLQIASELQGKSATKILFDPQTSGGLLLAVPEHQIEELLSQCGKQAKVIGRIVKGSTDGCHLSIVIGQ